MGLLALLCVGASLTALFVAGWIFLQQSLYKELDDSEILLQASCEELSAARAETGTVCVSSSHCCAQLLASVQCIFSLVFAFSVNLVQLILFEILGFLPYRYEDMLLVQAL